MSNQTPRTSHTPGPWIVKYPWIVASDKRKTHVAEVTGAMSNETAHSDARLIAAAPALLEAALKIIRECDTVTIDRHAQDCACGICALRTAIRLAQGEAE